MNGVVVVIDAASHEWQFGLDVDSGPAVILPAASTPEARRELLSEAFTQLEVEPPSATVLLSEPAGSSLAHCHQMADELFAFGVCALHIAAAPLLALIHTGFDTGMLVHVGHDNATLFAVSSGLSLLDSATHYPLPTDERGRTGPVAELICRTLSLADVSLREGLLQRVVLVGGGEMGPSFGEEMRGELEARQPPSSGWGVKTYLPADRRLACWMGGVIFSSLPSNEDKFLTREEYERDPRCLSTSHWHSDLATRGMEEQGERVREGRASEASRREVERGLLAEVMREVAEEARGWWVRQAGVGTLVEKERQQVTQRLACAVHMRNIHHLLSQPSSSFILDCLGGNDPAARLTRQLHTGWACSQMNRIIDVQRVEEQWRRAAIRAAWRGMMVWALSVHAFSAQLGRAVSKWANTALSHAIQKWVLLLHLRSAERGVTEMRNRSETRFGFLNWRVRGLTRGHADRLLLTITSRFEHWRVWSSWLLFLSHRIRNLLLEARARLRWERVAKARCLAQMVEEATQNSRLEAAANKTRASLSSRTTAAATRSWGKWCTARRSRVNAERLCSLRVGEGVVRRAWGHILRDGEGAWGRARRREVGAVLLLRHRWRRLTRGSGRGGRVLSWRALQQAGSLRLVRTALSRWRAHIISLRTLASTQRASLRAMRSQRFRQLRGSLLAVRSFARRRRVRAELIQRLAERELSEELLWKLALHKSEGSERHRIALAAEQRELQAREVASVTSALSRWAAFAHAAAVLEGSCESVAARHAMRIRRVAWRAFVECAADGRRARRVEKKHRERLRVHGELYSYWTSRLPVYQNAGQLRNSQLAVARSLAHKVGLDGGCTSMRAQCDALAQELKEFNLDDDVCALLEQSVEEDGDMEPYEQALAHLKFWERKVARGWVLSNGQLSYVDLCLWMTTSQFGTEWLRARGFTALARHAVAVAALPGVHTYSQRVEPPESPPSSPSLFLLESQSSPQLVPKQRTTRGKA